MTAAGFEAPAVAYVRSPLADRESAPLQGDEGAPEAWLDFEPRFADGMRDLGRATTCSC